MLQRVILHYKSLPKIGMGTSFKVDQEVFFLKEGDKLL